MSGFLDQFFVYHPSPWEDRDWARLSRLPLEDVWFEASDRVRLFGWFVPGRGGRDNHPVLLWCHGNAGNISHRLENVALLHRLGISVLLFDYRGYGRSQGNPTEEGLYRDAMGAYEYLTKIRGIRASKLIIFGRSLGGPIAGYLASHQSAAGLVLESTFPSIEAVARHHYFGLPMHWFLGAEFDLASFLPRIRIPLLVIHGDQDDIIPFQFGQEVFQAALEPKSFYRVPGADHNSLYRQGGEAYFQRLLSFIRTVT